MDGGQDSTGPGGKRSLLDKLMKRGKNKDDQDSLKSMPPSTKSFQDPYKAAKILHIDSTPLKGRNREQNGGVGFDMGYSSKSYDPVASDHTSHRKLLGHGKRGAKRGSGSEPVGGKDAVAERNGSVTSQNNTFHLDTDLSRMDGIVSQPMPMTPQDGGIFTGLNPSEEPILNISKNIEEATGPNGSSADWNAPDSWAVKKVADENISRLREIDDDGVPSREADDGVPYCVRIFRVDSTFATLSTHLNSTVEELLRQLGKKSFLQDDLENYQIVMKKHDLQRVLSSGERPIAIQKRLLEQAGYTETDRIDEIGREDNSYLCRFTFVPARLSGFYSLVRPPSPHVPSD